MAALLIARQVIGNLKESAVPYLIEQLRLARLSFELFGALSPSEARPPPSQEGEEVQGGKDNEEKEDRPDSGKSKQPRNVSQAELESSLYRVGHPTNSLLSDVTLKVWSRFSQFSFFFSVGALHHTCILTLKHSQAKRKAIDILFYRTIDIMFNGCFNHPVEVSAP